MEQSYQDHLPFSMGEQVEDIVTEIEILKDQDMTSKVDQCRIDKGIPHMITEGSLDLFKEGTMELHKIIHHNRIMGIHRNRIMGHQDRLQCQ